jgi:hypothetical protein
MLGDNDMTWLMKTAIAAILLPTAVLAQPSLSPTALLGTASDAALDKLSKPGAFAADDAIKIALPGPTKSLGGLSKFASQAGLTDDLTASLNNAAGAAASEAKPIFRAAIDNMSVSDMAGIATGGGTAATDYLKRSAGSEVNAKLAPLVRSALSSSGVLNQTSQLSSIGMTPDKINDYVTQKTADGIFTYIGREEQGLRANPLGAAKSVFGTLTK